MPKKHSIFCHQVLIYFFLFDTPESSLTSPQSTKHTKLVLQLFSNKFVMLHFVQPFQIIITTYT